MLPIKTPVIIVIFFMQNPFRSTEFLTYKYIISYNLHNNNVLFHSFLCTFYIKNDIISAIDLVENIIKRIKANGNIELILDKFVIEMRKFYE